MYIWNRKGSTWKRVGTNRRWMVGQEKVMRVNMSKVHNTMRSCHNGIYYSVHSFANKSLPASSLPLVSTWSCSSFFFPVWWPFLGVLLPAVLRWSFAPSSIWASLTLKGLMGNLCWGTWVPINQTEAESRCLFGALAWSPQATQRLFPMYTHSVLQSPWGWRYGFILGSSAPKCKDSVQGTYLQGSVTHAWATNSSKQMLAFYCRRPRSRKVNRASSHTSNEKSPYTSLGLLEFRI